MTNEEELLLRQVSAASLKGKFGAWRPQYESLLGDLTQGNLKLVRKRCREACVNSPIISSLISELEAMVVGRGVQVEFTHTTDRHARTLNRLWDKWINSVSFSADGELDFYSMQKLIFNEVSTVGEVFLKKEMRDIDDPAMEVPLQYQVFPADQLADDVTLGYSAMDIPKEIKENSVFINGIGFDKKGLKIGFIFFDNEYDGNALYAYPYVARANRKFVPASEVHHVYNRKEVRFRRGWPLIGTAIVQGYLGKMLDEAQLTKQIVAAMFAAFVHDNSADVSLETGEDEKEEGNLGSELQGGTIYELPTGKDVKFSDAPQTRDYKDFDQGIARKAAASVGASYEAVAGNHSDANYSSARQSFLSSDRRMDKCREEILIKQFVLRVIEDFKSYVKTMAIVPMEGCGYELYRPGKIVIDPAKEINPKTQEVKSGFKSWSEVIRERGMNPDAVAKRISEDQKIFDKYGLTLDTDPRVALREAEANAQQNQTED